MIKKVCTFILIVSSSLVSAQYYVRKNPTEWMLSVNWSFTQDAGLGLQRAFDFSNTFNYEFFPTQLTFTKNIRKAWSWEIMGTYNQLYNNNIINCFTDNGGLLAALDASIQYSFAKHDLRRKKLARLEPFLSAGFGVTYRDMLSVPNTPTVAAVAGLNWFFTEILGIQFRVISKYGITSELWSTEANYMNYNVGLVYRQLPKSRKSSPNNSPRHAWTKKKPRFRKSKNYKVK